MCKGATSIANKGVISNAGFVVTGDGVVAFDALGTPALGRAMIAAIGGVTHAPIRRVIVSHYHADHIYGLQAFRGVEAEIWAHRKAELYLASDLAFFVNGTMIEIDGGQDKVLMDRMRDR